MQQDGPLPVDQQLMQKDSMPQQFLQGAWPLNEQQQLTSARELTLRPDANDLQQWEGPDRSSYQPPLPTASQAQQAYLQAYTNAANIQALHTQGSGFVQRPAVGNGAPYQPLTSHQQQVAQTPQGFATSASPAAPMPGVAGPFVRTGGAIPTPVPQRPRLLPPGCQCQKCQEQRRLAPPGCRCLQCLQWRQAGQQIGQPPMPSSQPQQGVTAQPPVTSSQAQQGITGLPMYVQPAARQAQSGAVGPSSVPRSSQGPQVSYTQPFQADWQLGQGPSSQQGGHGIPLPQRDGSQYPPSQAQQASGALKERQPKAPQIDANASGQVQNSWEGLAILGEVVETGTVPQLARQEHRASLTSEGGAALQEPPSGQPAVDPPATVYSLHHSFKCGVACFQC